ncbi:MAG: response regulator receiver modulated CheB methylesterase, partial [Cyanobacteria bacterium RYN_339]|nr:response regulator receiver modulated CheB methylesterase [Cyanobacteria bacterium RYN_339]
DLVVIGASTGGPAAVLEVLRALPPDFALPILFVLHIGEPFGQALADWMAGNLKRRVIQARDGDPLPRPGEACVYMAPPDRHLVVQQGRLVLTDGPERHSCRPSVDVLFESVARELGPRAVACLLTGMGRDGAAGMLAIKDAGGLTIAQDEATSVVYGMPREAVLLGAAMRVLPLDAIGPALLALAPGR